MRATLTRIVARLRGAVRRPVRRAVDRHRGQIAAMLAAGDVAGARRAVVLAHRLRFVDSDTEARVAAACADAGDWHGAIALSRMGSDTRSLAALGRVAATAAESPFVLDVDRYRQSTVAERADWAAIAADAREALVAADPGRVRDLHRLGEDRERLGDLVAAADCYERALKALDDVDAAWTHQSRVAWRYRLDSARRLDPGAPKVHYGSPVDVGPLAGSVRARPTAHGLVVEGVVLPGRGGEVVVSERGRTLRTITVDDGPVLRPFSWTILHHVLAEADPRLEFSVHCDGIPLSNPQGGSVVVVTVPAGTGTLAARLDAGHTINKKGRLSPPATDDAGRRREWLKAYAAARDTFRSALGRDLFAVYGTLLGVRRDGGPIVGDDDFDVGMLCTGADPASIRSEIVDVMVEAVRAGFDVRVAIDGRPFHLGVDGVGIDVNPVWFHRGRCFAFAGHRLDRSAFDPCGTVVVDGVEVSVPGDADAVLIDTYGPEWTTPDSAFRHYRPESDLRALRRVRLLPSEVDDLRRRASEASAAPGAGRFLGYADPAHPEFDARP